MGKRTQSEEELSSVAKHYESLDDFPKHTRSQFQTYWNQRYNIFSEYDNDIWMTEDAWYGVTREAVANKIAEHVANATPADKSILIDAFAGVGGNTIAFARSGRWRRVYAIEKDPGAMACAQHNAKIYGVHNQITWFDKDCFDVLNTQLKEMGEYAVIFGSPPWGGYREDKVFNLSTMQPYPLEKLYGSFANSSEHVVLYLPRTSDLRQLAAVVQDGRNADVIHYCTEAYSRALCIYLGPFDFA